MNKKRNFKILFVDDHERLHKILIQKLDELNENVVVLLSAFTVKRAEELFEDNSDIDLIIMDACVPPPDEGITTLGLVHKFRKTFHGTMIAASSFSSCREALLKAGCNYEVEKYYSSNALYEAVCKVLGLEVIV